ncbi:MAG: DUF1254 domain-containing protein [Acidimicrobiales bacterium]|nr:DUF1254 domain-containing protein [Acidimicrobiales bacterium]
MTGPGPQIVVSPNVDTLYSVAVLDLRRGPEMLTVPAIQNRYYVYQFLDMFTQSFAYVGTRATAGRAGSWVVAAPGWHGQVPTGDSVIRSSTPVVFLLGRFLVFGETDLPATRAMMAQVRLAPLNGAPSLGQSHSRPNGTESTATLPATQLGLGAARGSPQNVAQAGAAFFDELGDDLAVNPPTTSADRSELDRFASLGVGPGRHPAANGTSTRRAALARGVSEGAAQVLRAVASTSHGVNGWVEHLDVGRYSSNFLVRAEIAQTGWGSNIPQEAVYINSSRDGHGDPYSGSRSYVMRFPAGSLPPAKAFWSLTAYGPDRFLVANAEDRYSIGSHTPRLQTNPDGSLDLYLQATLPSAHTSNWLPIPTDEFTLTMRIYLPLPPVLLGRYRLPPVEPTDP